MNNMALTRNEYVVLRAYAEMANSEYLNNSQLAKVIGCPVSKLRSVIESLKEKSLLDGEKRVGITPQGVEVFKHATRMIMEAEAEVAVDSSAAAPTGSAGLMNPPIVPAQDDPKKLSEIVAAKFKVDPDRLWDVIKNNVINVGQGSAPSNEETMQVLSVMHKYDLDPFVKQVYAFRHQGRLQIMVSMDGWVSIANRMPGYKGVEIEYPEMSERVDAPSGGKKAWPWIKATCHVEGRIPTTSIVFLEEWFVSTRGGDGNWEKYPSHRLEGKAITSALRKALGIALYDDVDADQFMQAEYTTVNTPQDPMELIEKANEQMLADPEDLPAIPFIETKEEAEGLAFPEAVNEEAEVE